MVTKSKPLATPKKGAAKGVGSGGTKRQGRVFVDYVLSARVARRRFADPLTVRVTRTKGNPGNRELMIKHIKSGLDFSVVTQLETELNATSRELGRLLSIPPSTMARRKREGQLTADESDRVVRLARVRDAAVDLMDGDSEAAIHWLRMPLEALNNESPLEHSGTELGARDVEDLILRLKHGVFS